MRYIHQNPIKEGITNSVAEYKWSRYHEYISKQNIIYTEFILELFAKEKHIAKKKFQKYTNEATKDICLDYEERHLIGDDDLIKLIEVNYGVKKGFFHLLGRTKMDMILKDLKANKGVTIRQLARVTGVSKYMVEKA